MYANSPSHIDTICVHNHSFICNKRKALNCNDIDNCLDVSPFSPCNNNNTSKTIIVYRHSSVVVIVDHKTEYDSTNETKQ